jgi:hypothetical protein
LTTYVQYLYSFSSDLDPHNFEEFRTGSLLRSLLIRNEFITDPDPAFSRNADRIHDPCGSGSWYKAFFDRLEFSFPRLLSGNYQDSVRVFPLNQLMIKTLQRYREGEKYHSLFRTFSTQSTVAVTKVGNQNKGWAGKLLARLLVTAKRPNCCGSVTFCK